MTDHPDDLQRQIAELQAQLAALKAAQSSAASRGSVDTGGGDAIRDKTVHGDEVRGDKIETQRTVGVTNGDYAEQNIDKRRGTFISAETLTVFFGGTPAEDGAALLANYLDAVITDCQGMRLGRLSGQRMAGSERSREPHVQLGQVYTSLVADGPPRTASKPHRSTAAHLRPPLERWERREHDGAHCPPELVRDAQLTPAGLVPIARLGTPMNMDEARANPLADAADDSEWLLHLTRPELVVEAIHHHRRLVLLGDPGSGKSTALRYLALALAHRARGNETTLHGWPGADTPVPILCPLGKVAAVLTQCGGDAIEALWRVLGNALDGEPAIRTGLRDSLKPALLQGGVILLCDGLDELPATAPAGGISPRSAIAEAIRTLLRTVPNARVVVTSRMLPYKSPGDWKLTADQGWAERTIQPWTFGQERRFVQAWYAALHTQDQTIDGDARAADLIGKVEHNRNVGALLRSPLLLTMLAILHFNTDDVPDDRVKVYDECVELLLQRWEPERTLDGTKRPGLLQKLGDLPGLTLELLRQVLHELAWDAHDRPTENDGRGLLTGEALEGKLGRFFKRVGSPNPSQSVDIFVQVLREDAGLLQERAPDRFAFPHLTFQEYLAACWLADHPERFADAYTRWNGPDGERWREVLLLLMGRLRHRPKDAERDGVPWLKGLISAKWGGKPKSDHQRRRDTALAAWSYEAFGTSVTLANAMLLDVEDELDAPLRKALARLLNEGDDLITFADRYKAARVLGTLGDPRFPVTLDTWQSELARRNERFGQPAGYWCYVPDGTYTIGGWKAGAPSADLALAPFWLARFPITVAQFAPFVQAGYAPQAERYWTPNGWQWKLRTNRTGPWLWTDERYNHPNQPVIGETWYEATAFCAWLTEHLADTLPAGHELRLPTEAEWEAAASFDSTPLRRPYPWGSDEPMLAYAVYDAANLDRPAPIGCCIDGAAACGATDLAGNVWECTSSSSEDYPAECDVVQGDFEQSERFTPDERIVPLRGGAYYMARTDVRCGARIRHVPDNAYVNFGFRVIVAPRRAGSS